MADKPTTPGPDGTLPAPELVIPPQAQDLYADMAQAAYAAGQALLALAETGHAQGVPDPDDLGLLANADWANYALSGKGLLAWAKLVAGQLAQAASGGAGGLIVVQNTLHTPPS